MATFTLTATGDSIITRRVSQCKEPGVRTRPNGTAKRFHADRAFWQSVLPICKFEAGTLASLELHPITLGLDRPRTERGEPALAGNERGM